MLGIGIADAGTLGWAQMVTTVATEVRAVGLAAVIVGMIVAGIEIIMHRHLDRMGQTFAAIGVGGGVIAMAPTAAQALLGAVGATPLTPPLVYVITLGDVAGVVLYYAPVVGLTGLWTQWRRRHGE